MLAYAHAGGIDHSRHGHIGGQRSFAKVISFNVKFIHIHTFKVEGTDESNDSSFDVHAEGITYSLLCICCQSVINLKQLTIAMQSQLSSCKKPN